MEAAGLVALSMGTAQMINMGASAGQATHIGQAGSDNLSTNAICLRKCRQIASCMRSTSAETSRNAPPFEHVCIVESIEIDRFARAAERLTFAKQSPSRKFKDASAMIMALLEKNLASHDVHEVILVLLKIKHAACIVAYGEASIASAQIHLDFALSYARAHGISSAMAHIKEGLTSLDSLTSAHSARAHLRAKLLFAESLLLLGKDPRLAGIRAKGAVAEAEKVYTLDNGLAEYRQLRVICDGIEEGSELSLESVDGLWARVLLLQVHCGILSRADKSLRAPAIPNSRRKLLELIKLATTKEDLDRIEGNLRADVLAADEKSKKCKYAVVGQCDKIVDLSQRIFRDSLSILRGAPSGTSNKLVFSACCCVAVIAARAALRVQRYDACRRFASAADALMINQLGIRHPLVILNRVTLASTQLFHGKSAVSEVRRAISQLSSWPQTAHSHPMCNDEAIDMPAEPSRVFTMLEESLKATMEAESPVGRDFGTLLSCISALHAHYTSENDARARLMLALWTDALADFLGPRHPLTLSKITEYNLGRNDLAPPRFRPSGGVCPILTNVEIDCESPDCEIFVTFDGDTPSATGKSASSIQCLGSVVLDRLGTVVLKAATFRGGSRSTVVEARFVVVPGK